MDSFFSRPIQLVLVSYGLAFVMLLILGLSYWKQLENGEVMASTKGSFWGLLILLSLGLMKLGIELMIPKYRRQYFRKTEKASKGFSENDR